MAKRGIELPHFAYPFGLYADGSQPKIVEEDSDEEISDCVKVILLTEKGERIDDPNFGLEDQTFRMGGTDLDAVKSAVSDHEPRADVNVSREEFIDMLDTVRVELKAKTNE